jgi:hypothetical protein
MPEIRCELSPIAAMVPAASPTVCEMRFISVTVSSMMRLPAWD